ncbi:MAG: (Fe-S)-binding protein [Bacteroidetes bacterium]|nr:(Fe-S)-binding protein [Bacteroidota bacterium]MBK7137691.1 (Fe-S)-binding protein [Bacteroidota bacterium]MBK7505510.1 (Fe-S)-binding protein [Bacteroidota bacterium]MBK8671830.1 (Fe-S)-binding protein [Bacteroidota bacterium]MBK9355292.1 (Fe-S)-binding protein [Bacteroidota bacterium]
MSDYKVPVMAELAAEGKAPEVLFWVGCAGSFDQRAQSVTMAFVKILNNLNIDFAVLGPEEACSGDPARRAGNEFVFQMLAQQNIATLNMYNVKKIVTACPHCFNTLKNEYPELGGNYEVVHHSTFLQQLINDGKLKVEGGEFKGKKITFHDSCYLGRANDIYEAPRAILEKLDAELVEMKKCKTKGLCCGAGGAQMFKEDEPGNLRINEERTNQALEVQPDFIAVACPFCNTMMTDGVKGKDKQDSIKVFDLAEFVAKANKY